MKGFDVQSIGSWSSIISLPLSVLACIFSLFFLNRPSVVAETWYIIILNGCLLVIVAALCIRLSKQARGYALLENAAKKEKACTDAVRRSLVGALEAIESVSKVRTGLSTHIAALYMGINQDRNESISKSHNFIAHLLNSSKNIFDIYTGDKCAVCIKLFSQNHPSHANKGHLTRSEKQVETLARDSTSRTSRCTHVDDKKTYSYKANTAFQKIIDQMDIQNYWFCNDLRSQNDYFNGNPLWNKYYNATAVIAIADPDDVGPERIIGFLCVDNMNGGFEKDVTKLTLSIMANTLYYVLTAMYLIASGRGNEPT